MLSAVSVFCYVGLSQLVIHLCLTLLEVIDYFIFASLILLCVSLLCLLLFKVCPSDSGDVL